MSTFFTNANIPASSEWWKRWDPSFAASRSRTVGRSRLKRTPVILHAKWDAFILCCKALPVYSCSMWNKGSLPSMDLKSIISSGKTRVCVTCINYMMVAGLRTCCEAKGPIFQKNVHRYGHFPVIWVCCLNQGYFGYQEVQLDNRTCGELIFTKNQIEKVHYCGVVFLIRVDCFFSKLGSQLILSITSALCHASLLLVPLALWQSFEILRSGISPSHLWAGGKGSPSIASLCLAGASARVDVALLWCISSPRNRYSEH